MILNEREFQQRLLDVLNNQSLVADFADFQAVGGANLLYNVIVDAGTGNYAPALPSGAGGLPEGKPPYFAFQTDILVKRRDGTPRVVLELKWREPKQRDPEGEPRGYNTDAIISYSAKALRHKQIYPYLRYGFVFGSRDKIGRKFFVHNAGFDFALAMRTEGEPLLQEDAKALCELVQRQVKCAEELIRLQSEHSEDFCFSTEIRCQKHARKASNAG